MSLSPVTAKGLEPDLAMTNRHAGRTIGLHTINQVFGPKAPTMIVVTRRPLINKESGLHQYPFEWYRYQYGRQYHDGTVTDHDKNVVFVADSAHIIQNVQLKASACPI